MILLVAVPFLGAIGSLIGRHWYPSSDQGLELLRIRDVGGSHTPLLGAWSRWGWAHPGPSLFWTLAPFYRVLGNNGVLVGVGLINGASAIGVVLVGYRRGKYVGALLAGFTVALVTNALGLGMLIEPWNPWVAFLPFVLYIGLVWSVLCGDLATLPLAVGVGSFVVQTHFGYLPMVGGLVLLAAVAAAASTVSRRRSGGNEVDRRARSRSLLRRPLILAGVVGLALWAPVIVQQATGHPGNLSELITYVRHPPEQPPVGQEPSAPWGNSCGRSGLGYPATRPPDRASSELPRRIGPMRRSRPSPRPDYGQEGAGRRTRCGWRSSRSSQLLSPWQRRLESRASSLRMSCAGGEAWPRSLISRSRGRWCSVLVRAGSVPLQWPRPRPAWLQWLRSRCSNCPRRFRSVPFGSVSEAIGVVVSPTAAALDRDHRYLVRSIDRRTVSAPTSGRFFALSIRGFHVFSDRGPDAVLTYGSWRLASPDQVDAIITMVAIPEVAAGWHPPAGSRVVATWDPLTNEQRARARTLDTRIRAAMGARAPTRLVVDSDYARSALVDDGADRREVDELGGLQAHGDGFFVYVSPSR